MLTAYGDGVQRPDKHAMRRPAVHVTLDFPDAQINCANLTTEQIRGAQAGAALQASAPP